MNERDIEHMWKVASNNPNHDTNWHDPVVINFAKLVVAHTLSIIDPFKYISCQEAFEAGQSIEREACAKVCEEVGEHPSLTPRHCVDAIRARILE